MDFVKDSWATIEDLFKKNISIVQAIDLDYEPDTLFLAAEIFLLILSIINIFSVLLFVFLILKSNQFHRNLICLILNLCLEGFIYFTCRMILISNLLTCTENCFDTSRFMFNSSLILVDFIRVTTGIGYLISMWFVFVERALATINLSTYEKHTDYFFIITCFIGQYFWGAIVAVIMYKDIINVLYLAVVGELGCILFSLTFFFFDQINQRRYKTSTKEGNSYTLSQRYQLAENIKSANFLKKSVVVVAIFNSVIMLMFVAMWMINKQSQKRWIGFSYELAISLYAFTLPITAIYSIDPWKRIFFKAVRTTVKYATFKRARVEDSGIAQERNLRTAAGNNMYFGVENEGRIYFEQLQNNWNT